MHHCAHCHGSNGEGGDAPRLVDLSRGALPLEPAASARVRSGEFRTAGDVVAFASTSMPIDAPGSPSLRGSRSPGSVDLSWSAPEPGSAPITSYRVERATNNEAFRDLASTVATATKYQDATAIDVAATYRFRVSAVNLHGAGAPSNTVAPTLPSQSVCGTPGLTISTDPAGDVVTVNGISVPAPPATDLVLLAVGEPYLAGGALDLVFQLKTAGLSGPLPRRPKTTVCPPVSSVTRSRSSPRLTASAG